MGLTQAWSRRRSAGHAIDPEAPPAEPRIISSSMVNAQGQSPHAHMARAYRLASPCQHTGRLRCCTDKQGQQGPAAKTCDGGGGFHQLAHLLTTACRGGDAGGDVHARMTGFGIRLSLRTHLKILHGLRQWQVGWRSCRAFDTETLPHLREQRRCLDFP